MTAPYALAFWAMMVAYAMAVGAQIGRHVLRLERLAAVARWTLGPALAVHTGLVAWRWVATGHVPVIGNFENALFGAWFIAVMVAWTAWREQYPLVGAAALPFALLVLGGGALSDTTPSPFVAALRSFWLYIHVFFAWLAYGAYTVACGAGIVYLSRTRASRPAPPKEDLARLDELMFRSTAFGFVTDGVMIAAGAIWAKDLWGSYWSWDPVETWSLLSWVIYGLVLHLRTTLGWRGRPIAWILVFAVLTVIVTFWGVNLVMSGSTHVFNVD